MRYLLSLLVPPLSLLIGRHYVQALCNAALWPPLWLAAILYHNATATTDTAAPFGIYAVIVAIIGWPVCILHAVTIAARDDKERRHRELLATIAATRAEAPIPTHSTN